MLGMWAYQPRPNMSRPQKKKKKPQVYGLPSQARMLELYLF